MDHKRKESDLPESIAQWGWRYHHLGMHLLVQAVPHLAFEVDDLDKELQRHSFHILHAPNSPAEGIRVAMIEHDGAPIELIEFNSPSSG